MPAIKKSALEVTATVAKKSVSPKGAVAPAKKSSKDIFALSDRMGITRGPAKKAAPVKTPATKAPATKTAKAKTAAPAKKVAPAKVPAKKVTTRNVAVLSPEDKKAQRLTKGREGLAPLKTTLNKTQLMERLAQDLGMEKRDVVKVYGGLVKLLLSSMMPKGCGEFTLPEIAKLTAKKIPAKKGGQKVVSFGVERISKAKPATVRVKCRLLAKVRQVALPL